MIYFFKIYSDRDNKGQYKHNVYIGRMFVVSITHVPLHTTLVRYIPFKPQIKFGYDSFSRFFQLKS